MSNVIPQANNWDTVEKLLLLIANSNLSQKIDKEYVADYFKFDIRQSDYYAQALNFLGFIEKNNEKIWPLKLNELGIMASKGKINEKSIYEYVLIFLNDWSAVGAIIGNKENEAITELMDLDDLNENTAKRRISTIKSWYKELTKRLEKQVKDFGLSSEAASKFIQDNEQILKQKHSEKVEKNNEKISKALDTIPQNVIEGDEDNSNYEKSILKKVRKGHHTFTKNGGEFWNNTCAISGIDFNVTLVHSHIKSWADSIGCEKIDFNNCLVLDSRYDKLFDRHIISFNDDRTILISNILPYEAKLKYGLEKFNNLSKPLTEKMKEYMLYHRNKFYEKQKSI